MNRETPRKFATTPGTRDVLPPESTRLLDVQAEIRARFRLFGFREVVTPALEYSEVIEEHGLRDASYKLFDQDNQMLFLRPEMTTPIARLVAQRLAGSPEPHKLSYVLPAYRRANVGRGQSAELYQAGVEVVGSASAREDAATIALLVDVLQSLALRAPSDFAVVLGQSAFYSGYLRHVAPNVATPVTAALAAKDLVAVDALARELPSDAAAGIRGIPRLVGPATDGSIVEEAERFAVGEARAALENLREILRHLEAHGAIDAVILDLGLIGRHDLERLLSVLPEEKAPPLLVLVGGDTGGVEAAERLRENGVPVLHLPEDLTPEDAAQYARSVEAAWICYPAEGGVKIASAEPQGEFGFMDYWSVAETVLR
jgi:ATP phosphoribosyltransferase regulatory subunit